MVVENTKVVRRAAAFGLSYRADFMVASSPLTRAANEMHYLYLRI
jgi:hypothetical protein